MSGELRTAGVSSELEPDGSQRVHIERVDVRDLKLDSSLGAVSAASASLSNVTVRLGAAPRSAGPLGRLRELGVGELRLEGARIEAPIVLPPNAFGGPNTDWRLEPLSSLEGSMRADITDAHWVFDADVTIPIAGGRIDFDRATVEHVGPDSSMGISRMGVYVDAPNGRTYLYLFSATHIPGAVFERRGALFARRTGSRGSIELRPFVECFLSGVPMGALAAGIRDIIARTRVSADLRLGDGVMGDERNRVVLAGREQGRNRIELSSVAAGEATLRVHDLSVAESRLEMSGKAFTTGPLSATLSLRVTNFPARPIASATIAELSVRDVAYGERQGAAADG
jgi:hypothetical protein